MRPTRRRSDVIAIAEVKYALRVSPHSLSMFRECRRRYKFHYLDGLAERYGRARPQLTAGDHIHATLKDLLSAVPVEQRTVARAEALLHQKWRRYRHGFRDAEDEERWVEKALSQIRRFVASYPTAVRPLMVERFIEVEISPRLLLRGRVDRVDRELDGSLHVIDYKTGRIPDKPELTQLYLYAVMVSRTAGIPVTKASLFYLDQGVVHTVEPTRSDLEATTRELLATAAKIATERLFPSSRGAACRRCDFGEICVADEPSADGLLA